MSLKKFRKSVESVIKSLDKLQEQVEKLFPGYTCFNTLPASVKGSVILLQSATDFLDNLEEEDAAPKHPGKKGKKGNKGKH